MRYTKKNIGIEYRITKETPGPNSQSHNFLPFEGAHLNFPRRLPLSNDNYLMKIIDLFIYSSYSLASWGASIYFDDKDCAGIFADKNIFGPTQIVNFPITSSPVADTYRTNKNWTTNWSNSNLS